MRKAAIGDQSLAWPPALGSRSRARNRYVPAEAAVYVPESVVTPLFQFVYDNVAGFLTWTSNTRPAGGAAADHLTFAARPGAGPTMSGTAIELLPGVPGSTTGYVPAALKRKKYEPPGAVTADPNRFRPLSSTTLCPARLYEGKLQATALACRTVAVDTENPESRTLIGHRRSASVANPFWRPPRAHRLPPGVEATARKPS